MRNRLICGALVTAAPLQERIDFCMYGVVEKVWKSRGNWTVSTHLRLFGGFGDLEGLEVIWRSSGSYLEVIWKSFGRDLEVIWRSSGNHLELIWTSFAVILISCETKFQIFDQKKNRKI